MARILLIDDDPVIVRIYASRLGTDGHAVTTAGSAAEAFAALAADAPDLVLLDLMLPDRPGVEVLRELRARPATAQVPVVVLSNAYLAEDMAAARSAGASAVAAKATCGPRQVGELVRRHLEPAPAPRPPATADPVVAPVTLPAFTAPVIGSEEQAGQRIVTSVLAEVRRDLPGLRKATPAVQREALGRLHRRLHQVIGAATVAGRSACADLASAAAALVKSLAVPAFAAEVAEPTCATAVVGMVTGARLHSNCDVIVPALLRSIAVSRVKSAVMMASLILPLLLVLRTRHRPSSATRSTAVEMGATPKSSRVPPK